MRLKSTQNVRKRKRYKKLLKELNHLLLKYNISDKIKLEEFSVCHMIRLYEALYHTKFPFADEKNESRKTQVKYVKFLLGTISHESLRIDLSYIDPVLVIKRDMKSMMNIVEILVIAGHLQRLKERIAAKQDVNVEDEGSGESDSFISDEILDCEEEEEKEEEEEEKEEEEEEDLENNEGSVCNCLKESQDVVHTPNSLVSSGSVMSYFTNRANKVFNRIRSLNLDTTQPKCVNETFKRNLKENTKDQKKQGIIKNKNHKKNKISKHCRSIGTQTLLPYFSETPNSQISPLSSSPDESYQCSSKIRTCSIKKMMQKVSLNTWESQTSEDESLEFDLSGKENIKTSINKEITDIHNFQQGSLKRNEYYNQPLNDKIIPNNNENMHYHLLHTSHKVTPLRLRQNISQESSPNSDSTNIEFFKQKFHKGILTTDSPYTLYLRKRRKNALNALYAQRSCLEQNLKLSNKNNRKISANHSKTKIKNIPHRELYNRPLSDISFYSPSELKSQTSFFSNYDNSITDLEKQLQSTKKLYSKES
ncbi:hypothetical protein T552_00871 [Pneumocystis carinii B80]|uniref:DUF5745 domain-containing protein n=1 Tax=Pneumocystis carinii (strain B80) TaxID=1408658 RepID=A0A0W4ZMR3_PNEC8|nr:hypothetical protein T552_00871 [Pneumocystis carinii B80]KTW29663.1 hypothetical protein T552_00871 [Pneumocystis carinii B80]